jgi:hypothetical protein
MADDDDVDTAASGGGKAAGQVKSMFSYGSGKVATISAKALERGRQILADNDDVGIAASLRYYLRCYPKFPRGTGFLNPYVLLQNEMENAIFILQWEREHLIEGPSKMTFGTSNLLAFFLAERYMIIKGVLDSTRPGLHNGLRK